MTLKIQNLYKYKRIQQFSFLSHFLFKPCQFWKDRIKLGAWEICDFVCGVCFEWENASTDVHIDCVRQ